MMKELKELKRKPDGNMKKENEELKSKLKKSQDNLKLKTELLDEAEARVNDLNIKLGEEAKMRAKAEAESVRSSKMCDHLQETLAHLKNGGDEGLVKVDQKCHILERDGKCRFGS